MLRFAAPAALLCAALMTASAHASPSQLMLFEAGAPVLHDATREPALDELQALGVRSIRVVLYWRDVAPAAGSAQRPDFDATDPAAYDWGAGGRLVDSATARGLGVLLTVTGPVPRWATQRRLDQRSDPRPAEFRAFMTAAGRRFAGQVATWGIWNEPNHPHFLGPQYVHGRNTSARIYRRLYQAGTAGLADAGRGGDTVLIGETAPGGDGKHSTPALAFLRGVLCVDSRYRLLRGCAHLDAGGWAHHPYANRRGPYYRPGNRDNVTIGVLSRLTSALDRAAKGGAIRRATGVWLTEFGVQSLPDPYLGVSLARQAELRSASERLAWGNPRVRAFSQYLLVDDDPRPGPVSQRYSGFESGLVSADGRRKPAYDEFRLPLSVRRSAGGRVSLWGLVRPAAGATHVDVLVTDRGSSVATTAAVRPTDAHGVWTVSLPNRAGRTWRVRWTAPDGMVFTGPPVRAMA